MGFFKKFPNMPAIFMRRSEAMASKPSPSELLYLRAPHENCSPRRGDMNKPPQQHTPALQTDRHQQRQQNKRRRHRTPLQASLPRHAPAPATASSHQQPVASHQAPASSHQPTTTNLHACVRRGNLQIGNNPSFITRNKVKSINSTHTIAPHA